MLFRMALVLSTILVPSHAYAKSPITLDSQIFVERVVKSDTGSKVVLEKPKRVVPGDNLVFVLNYTNQGHEAARDFVVTNPLPAAVAFVGGTNGSALVSVDGGKSWGALDQLKIVRADGSVRPAEPDDVTHIKWQMNQSIAAGSGGKLMYRGRVK